MDPISIATAAAAILAPYLSTLAVKAGEKVTENLAGKAGTGASGAVDALYQAIKRKFAADHDTDAEQSLTSLAAKPDSEARQATVAEVLADKAQADPAFAKELADLVQQAGKDPGVTQFLTNVYGEGRVGKIINVGQQIGNFTVK